MSWVTVGVAGGGMAMSYLNNQEKKKNEKADMLANAEAMRYSPWTKMNPTMQTHQAGSDIAAAMGGALQGAAFGSQFHKAAAPAAPDAVNAGTENTLGGQDMSKQLGANVPAMQAQIAPMAPQAPAPAPMSFGPGLQMDASNGANPGSPWGLMGRKKQTLYGSTP